MENPSLDHLKAAKRVLRYIKGTLNYRLRYKQNEISNLIGYFDSDYDRNHLGRKNRIGRVFFMGGKLITWTSQKQRVVTLSSCEVEYIALNASA